MAAPGSLSAWSGSFLGWFGNSTWASRLPAPDSSHGVGPTGPGRGLVCRDVGPPGPAPAPEGLRAQS